MGDYDDRIFDIGRLDLSVIFTPKISTSHFIVQSFGTWTTAPRETAKSVTVWWEHGTTVCWGRIEVFNDAIIVAERYGFMQCPAVSVQSVKSWLLLYKKKVFYLEEYNL